jgi:hypothetical protein
MEKKWPGQASLVCILCPFPRMGREKGALICSDMARTSPHILIRSIGPLEKRRTVSILPSFYILQNRVKPYLKSHLKLQQHDYFMGSNISKNKFWILHLLKYFLGKQDVMTLLCSAVTMPKKRRLRCGYPVFKDRSAGTRGQGGDRQPPDFDR